MAVLQVKTELSRKAPKAASMRSKCDQLWLVIVQDPFVTSAPCELPAEVDAHGNVDPLDRAYWLGLLEARVVELVRSKFESTVPDIKFEMHRWQGPSAPSV